MDIQIKRMHPDAIIPKYSNPGDAGLDITAVEVDISDDVVTYETGIAISIPDGYVGLLFPRSSIYKKDLYLTNSVGVIDSKYRGQLLFKYKINNLNAFSNANSLYKKGDRIGQLIIIKYPEVNFIEVDDLDSTERGSGGFGSTGE